MKSLYLAVLLLPTLAYGQKNIELRISKCDWDMANCAAGCPESIAELITDAASKNKLQFFDPADLSKPMSYRDYLRGMEMEATYYPWEAQPDYGTYQPWTIVRYNDTLYRALTWITPEKPERPDTSAAWALTAPEMNESYDLHVVVRMTRVKKTYRPDWIVLHNFQSDKDVAACRFSDVVNVLNASRMVWHKPDAFQQASDGFYLMSAGRQVITKELDTLQGKGITQFRGDISKSTDDDILIRYKNNKVDQMILMESSSYDDKVPLRCDTLDYVTMQQLHPFKMPGFYKLGDALEARLMLEIPDSLKIRPIKEKQLSEMKASVPSVGLRVVEEVSLGTESGNFSFGESGKDVAAFSSQLLDVLADPTSAIPLYAGDSLSQQLSHEQLTRDIIYIPDTHFAWHPRVIFNLGDVVGYNAVAYRCIRAHFGILPGSNAEYWERTGPLTEKQTPRTMLLLSDIGINAEGTMTKKTLTAIGWQDSNEIESYWSTLVFVKVQDIRNYLAVHPESAVGWQRALDLIASENKSVKMLSYSDLQVGEGR